jgi:hypothetical protein
MGENRNLSIRQSQYLGPVKTHFYIVNFEWMKVAAFDEPKHRDPAATPQLCHFVDGHQGVVGLAARNRVVSRCAACARGRRTRWTFLSVVAHTNPRFAYRTEHYGSQILCVHSA